MNEIRSGQVYEFVSGLDKGQRFTVGQRHYDGWTVFGSNWSWIDVAHYLVHGSVKLVGGSGFEEPKAAVQVGQLYEDTCERMDQRALAMWLKWDDHPEPGFVCANNWASLKRVRVDARSEVVRIESQPEPKGDPNFRCPRCRSAGTLYEGWSKKKRRYDLWHCTNCGCGDMDVSERVLLTVADDVNHQKEFLARVLAEDARRFPEFADARRAAVLALAEMRPSARGVASWVLAALRQYEDERGGTIGSAPRAHANFFARFHQLNVKECGAILHAYEYARSQLRIDLKLDLRLPEERPEKRTRSEAIRAAFSQEQDPAKCFKVKS